MDDSVRIICEGPHRKGAPPSTPPTRIVSFVRGLLLTSSATEWMELPVSGRQRRQAHAAPAAEAATSPPRDADGGLDFDQWLAGAKPPKPVSTATSLAGEVRRPSAAKISQLLAAGFSAQEVVEAYETQWTPGTPMEIFGRQMNAISSLTSAGIGPVDLPHDQTQVNSRVIYSIKCPRCRDGRTRRAEKLWPLLSLIIEQVPPVEILGRPHRHCTLTIPQFWLIADEYDRRASTGT